MTETRYPKSSWESEAFSAKLWLAWRSSSYCHLWQLQEGLQRDREGFWADPPQNQQLPQLLHHQGAWSLHQSQHGLQLNLLWAWRASHEATLNLIISIKICQYCKAEIRQGVKHNCNVTERRLNMVEQLRTASKTTLETVTGAGLKEVERRQQGLASAGGGSPTSCEASWYVRLWY